MKKLIYISYNEKNKFIGVNKKMKSQCYEFSKYYHTKLIYPEGNNICIEDVNTMESKSITDALSLKKFKQGNIKKLFNLIRILKFNSRIKKIILAEKPDIIYIRKYSILNGIRILKKFKKRNDVYIIYEIPTYPYEDEMKKEAKHYVYVLNKIFDKSMEKISDLIPVVLGRDVEFNSKKYLPISNGINIADINVKNKSILKDGKLNLIGIANVSSWHGYDRVIKGLKNYYDSNPNLEVYFHIVGDGDEITNLKNLVSQYGLQDKVIFHGMKIGQELESIINISDIGIGSLGMHRAGLICGCTLKVREYCARGIPFVIGYIDKGFKDNFKYILKIKPDESDININRIIQFYDEIKDKNYINEMRSYAEENLTWEATMKSIINSIKL